MDSELKVKEKVAVFDTPRAVKLKAIFVVWPLFGIPATVSATVTFCTTTPWEALIPASCGGDVVPERATEKSGVSGSLEGTFTAAVLLPGDTGI